MSENRSKVSRLIDRTCRAAYELVLPVLVGAAHLVAAVVVLRARILVLLVLAVGLPILGGGSGKTLQASTNKKQKNQLSAEGGSAKCSGERTFR